jgi:hypothetical protein
VMAVEYYLYACEANISAATRRSRNYPATFVLSGIFAAVHCSKYVGVSG